MAEVVFVHGIGQRQLDSGDPIAEAWISAIEAPGGAGEAAALASLGTRSTMVFYGDVYGEVGAMGGVDDEWDAESLALAEELARLWIERAASRADDPRLNREGQAALEGLTDFPTTAEAQGPMGLVRRATAAAAHIKYFARPTFQVAASVVNRDLREITAYLTNRKGCRDLIRGRAVDAIGPDTTVVVAHSMGSLVAYEALHRVEYDIPLLVTIGSPLGLDGIIFPRLDPAAAFPRSVGRWVNAADTDDIVAADPNLADRFPRQSGQIIEDHVVDNGRDWHAATAYLKHQVVWHPILEVLGGAGG